MSFRCEYCGKSQPPRTKPEMIPQARMTIQAVVQEEYKKDLVRVYSEVSYKIIKEKRACSECAKNRSLRPEVVEVIDQTSFSNDPYLKSDSREKQALFSAHLLYSFIAFSGPSLKTISIAPTVFSITSFTIFPSSLLNF